jgi:DNA-directed RNA polymerase specialized sigma24 family protein
VASEAVVRVGVEAAQAAMPARRRACAVLCLLGGCSPKEAGKTLGIAEGTVRKQVERARNDLRMALEVQR